MRAKPPSTISDPTKTFPLPSNPSRTRRYTVLLTEEEFAELVRRCDNPRNLSDWIRRAIFSYHGPSPPEPTVHTNGGSGKEGQ